MELEDEDQVSFSSLFDEKDENKMQDIWPMMESCLEEDYGISCALDLAERCATISTTTSTKGPTCFRMASNVIELLTTTNVPPHLAIEILKGKLRHTLTKIGYQQGGLCSKYGINKEQFDKQWECFASWLPEISAISFCKVYLNENTIAAVGRRSQGEEALMVKTMATDCFVRNTDLLETLVSLRKVLFENYTKIQGEHVPRPPYVDYMRMEKLDVSDMQEIASYSIFFYKDREEAMQEAWPLVRSFSEQYGISCTLNLAKGVWSVSTTRKTVYPDLFYKVEEFVYLLGYTSVPPTKAKEVIDGRLQHELIKTWMEKGGLCRTGETFQTREELEKLQRGRRWMLKAQEHAKNRGRLMRKAQELATLLKCEIYINSTKVVAVGTSGEGLKLFRSIVEGCFLRNEDPAIVVKRLKMEHMVTDLMKKIQALCL